MASQCGNCGERASTNDRFCEACGHELASGTPSNDARLSRRRLVLLSVVTLVTLAAAAFTAAALLRQDELTFTQQLHGTWSCMVTQADGSEGEAFTITVDESSWTGVFEEPKVSRQGAWSVSGDTVRIERLTSSVLDEGRLTFELSGLPSPLQSLDAAPVSYSWDAKGDSIERQTTQMTLSLSAETMELAEDSAGSLTCDHA